MGKIRNLEKFLISRVLICLTIHVYFYCNSLGIEIGILN